MKLFISADIEGCAGTTLNYETHKDEPAYQKYAKQMTDEVVAVCEAALAAGVDEIVVKDGHEMCIRDRVKAEDIGMTGTELPEEVNSNKEVSDLLEKIRGVACCKMGFARCV